MNEPTNKKTVGWPESGVKADDLKADDLDALTEALSSGPQRAEPRGAREGDVDECIKSIGKLTRLRLAPRDLLVLHVPQYLNEKQFERIARVMKVALQGHPEVSYIVLPENVTFGKTIKTQMSRAELEQQLTALFGILMEDGNREEPIR